MFGYDIGARFDMDAASTGPLGYVDAQYAKNFGDLLPTDTLMEARREMGLLPSSGNFAEPDAALNAASELLAGTGGGVERDGEPEGGALPHRERSLLIPSDATPLGNSQQSAARSGRDEMGARADESPEARPDSDLGGMLAGMKSGLGDATELGNADMAGNAASAWMGAPMQGADPEGEGGFSLVDEARSAAKTGKGRFDVPDVAGLPSARLDVDYAHPRSAEAVESVAESGFVLDTVGRFGRRAKLETSAAPFATSVAGGEADAFDEFAATGIVGNGGSGCGHALSELGGLFATARDDGIIRGFEDPIPGGRIPIGAVKETDAADIGAAIAGLNDRFDQFTGAVAATHDRRESVLDGGTRPESSLELAEGAIGDVRGALRSQVDRSTLLPIHELPEGGITGPAGIWAMLRNAERFLPKPRIAGNRSEEAAPGEQSEGRERDLPGLLGKLAARGSLNEGNPEALDMRGSSISPDGGRSGPSGHKNDPIYTVAINQATGTLMPTVATAGTGTRSPAMPGQRNLA